MLAESYLGKDKNTYALYSLNGLKLRKFKRYTVDGRSVIYSSIFFSSVISDDRRFKNPTVGIY